MVPCLDRGNLWLQQSVVPKIHPSHNKASQTGVNVAESIVITIFRNSYNSDSTTNFSMGNHITLDRSPNSKDISFIPENGMHHSEANFHALP